MDLWSGFGLVLLLRRRGAEHPWIRHDDVTTQGPRSDSPRCTRGTLRAGSPLRSLCFAPVGIAGYGGLKSPTQAKIGLEWVTRTFDPT